jgi:beta-glucanase (GH16 family)
MALNPYLCPMQRALFLLFLFAASNFLTAQNSPFNYLMWWDEFPSYGPVDSTKWFHQTQLPNGGSWYNGELQHYTDRTFNCAQGTGIMTITARRDTFTDQGETKFFTSTRLNSKFAFTYGRVEVRAILPAGPGTWPAIWMLGQNINEDGAYWDNLGYGTTPWPACGEIDIMEHWGVNPNYVSSAIHTPSSFGGTINHGGRTIPGVMNTFHVYAMEWYPDSIVFSVDSTVHYVYKPDVKDMLTWPFDAPQYILLNIAINGDVQHNFQKAAMHIDYVRVYQESGIGVEENSSLHFELIQNPVIGSSLRLRSNSDQLNDLQLHIIGLNGQSLAFSSRIVGNLVYVEGLDGLAPGMYVLQLRRGNEHRRLRFIKN